MRLNPYFRTFVQALLISSLLMISGIGLAQDDAPPVVPIAPDTLEIRFGDVTGGDISMRGLQAAQSVWVQLPYNWTIDDDLVLNVTYVASEALHPDLASLTIGINGTPVASQKPITDGAWHTFAFSVPADLIYQGAGFLVDFYGYLRVSDDYCEDPQIPSQWITIGDISRIAIVPDTQPARPRLDQFTPSLISNSPFLVNTPLFFVLPERPDAATLTTAARVALRIGQQRNDAMPVFRVATANGIRFDERAAANLIAIGLPDTNAMVNVSSQRRGDGYMSPDLIAVPANHGMLQMMNSPYNPQRNLLIVSSETPEGLLKAGAAVNEMAAFSSLKGSLAFISDTPERVDVSYPWVDGTATLASLNFQDRTAFGLGSAELSYTIPRPRGRILESGSQVMLDIAFSPLAPGSHINVWINGFELGLHEIGRGIADRQFTFDLPVQELNEYFANNPAQDLVLQVRVANIFNADRCQQLSQQAVWTRVNNTTSITLNTSAAPLPDIAAFPYPFTDPELGGAVVLVIPDDPTQNEVIEILQLAASMGRNAIADIDLHLVTTSQLTDEHRDLHMVVYGSLARQPLVEEILTESADITGLIYDVQTTADAGVLRQVSSPWNAERAILLVYGETIQQAQWAFMHLQSQPLPVGVAPTLSQIQGLILIKES